MNERIKKLMELGAEIEFTPKKRSSETVCDLAIVIDEVSEPLEFRGVAGEPADALANALEQWEARWRAWGPLWS